MRATASDLNVLPCAALLPIVNRIIDLVYQATRLVEQTVPTRSRSGSVRELSSNLLCALRRHGIPVPPRHFDRFQRLDMLADPDERAQVAAAIEERATADARRAMRACEIAERAARRDEHPLP